MKIKALATGILAISVLTGCGVDNNHLENTSMRNGNDNGLTRVNNPGVNDYYYNDDRNLRGTDITPVRDFNNRNNNNTRNDSGRMRVADRAAERIADLPEVDHANVIVTENNAYVAAKLSGNNNKISRDVERKIADQVKKVDQDINDVYVSVNPDFYDRMTGYTDDIRNGKPIEGFFDEFSNMIRRVFPNHYNR